MINTETMILIALRDQSLEDVLESFDIDPPGMLLFLFEQGWIDEEVLREITGFQQEEE